MSKLYFIALSVVLFSVSWVFSENVDPDNEDKSNNLANFLEKLENFSGLGTNPPTYKISDITGCTEPILTECTVNPQGSIVWDIREELYANHMMQSKEEGQNNTATIDGCLNYYKNDVDAYITCMEEVRTSMINYLDKNFEDNFRSKLEANCSLAIENCFTAGSSS